MRHARLIAEGVGCYHVVSRIVDRGFRLDDGEKEIFRKMMRRAEAFCGVRVLTYAVMSNHFHLLVEVPERVEIDEAELVRRMTILYGEARTAETMRQWEAWRKTGAACLVEEQQNRLRARMYDLSAFVKTLKQRYSMSYNGRHGRKGTLWEDRFKSVLVENVAGAKAAVAAYIDLNPVRAKIVSDPRDYRWSGYGEACGGGQQARRGLTAVHDSRWQEQSGGWRHVQNRYRVLLYAAGAEKRASGGDRIVRPGIAPQAVDHVLKTGGRLTLPQALRCRVRYFTDGLALGGKAFVDGVFERNRRLFGPRRRDGARKMRFADWGELRTARALRVDAVRMPIPSQ
ncbi:MAG TPA: transposase [Kiritimatiellia bacterium]|nr:transposase [Kiritimatiellia bacterium]HRU70143.1 transposase [Kiritimatiellia bacterium]